MQQWMERYAAQRTMFCERWKDMTEKNSKKNMIEDGCVYMHKRSFTSNDVDSM